MANKNDKVDGNVDGKYYVDSSCIGCEMCVGTAPGNFKMHNSSDSAIVFKQPENADEQKVCDEAMGNCPVEAIGNDGESATTV